AITGASTINFLLGVTGGLRSTAWNTAWTGTVPANSVVNVANEVEDVLPNGFGIGAANMLNTKLHLGENVRLLQNYNESGTFNDAIQIGELTGAASSYLEGGWVDGRGREWQIGSLNTDAVFDGGIRGYHKFTAATDTTPEVITSGTSAIRLTKVGTGKWTVNGVVELPNSSRWTNTAGTTYETYGSITVNAGILELSNKVRFPVDNTIAHTVTVKTGATLILKDSLTAPRSNAITLTVDTIAFFNPNNQYIGANNIDIKGTLESGIFAGTNISFYDKSTVKLKVNTFDDGDYEQIQAEGDISVIAGAVIDITVATPTANKPIPLFVSVSADPTLVCRKVLVNGVDITANTEANTAEGYIWLVDVDGLGTGELLYVSPTGLNNPNADKAISTIQYFDIIGRQVSENSKGVVIKHIIYEDGTSYNQKLFIKE
ncbi:MAG: hypothetical protein LBV75_04155, partial [Paludibacter sp.]|nr:hypothetical protein [Paludibacter sp.]